MAKSQKQTELEQQLGELLQDLQRTRADFENYRKRVEDEKNAKFKSGQESMIVKLLPVIDNIERAVSHLPSELENNPWAQGVMTLSKNFDKILSDIGVSRIIATPGTVFDPSLHNAISDDESEGSVEIVSEELQAGYSYDGLPIRHSMVRVSRTDEPQAKQ